MGDMITSTRSLEIKGSNLFVVINLASRSPVFCLGCNHLCSRLCFQILSLSFETPSKATLKQVDVAAIYFVK